MNIQQIPDLINSLSAAIQPLANKIGLAGAYLFGLTLLFSTFTMDYLVNPQYAALSSLILTVRGQ